MTTLLWYFLSFVGVAENDVPVTRVVVTTPSASLSREEAEPAWRDVVEDLRRNISNGF